MTYCSCTQNNLTPCTPSNEPVESKLFLCIFHTVCFVVYTSAVQRWCLFCLNLMRITFKFMNFIVRIYLNIMYIQRAILIRFILMATLFGNFTHCCCTCINKYIRKSFPELNFFDSLVFSVSGVLIPILIDWIRIEYMLSEGISSWWELHFQNNSHVMNSGDHEQTESILMLKNQPHSVQCNAASAAE